MVMTAAGMLVIQSKMISFSSQSFISGEVMRMPPYTSALVLGSGTTTDPASRNYSYSSRMDVTASLYRKGGLKKITVSGASNKIYYNEPNDMKRALMEMNVPGSVIYPDHGGLRTFLSVKRFRELNPDVPVIIISQRQQLERALYIARCLKMQAFGLEAAPTPADEMKSSVIREIFARAKCRIECMINDK